MLSVLSRKLSTVVLAVLACGPAVWAQGIITTVAGGAWIFRGDGGRATDAPLSRVQAVAVDSAGNVFAADVENHIVVKVSPTRVLNVVAGNGIFGLSGDGGRATAAALSEPNGVAVDAAGNLYIADLWNDRVRKVSPSGIISTVAGGGGPSLGDGGPATRARLNQPVAVAVDSGGSLYIADRNNHRIRKVSGGTITTVAGNGTYGFSGDGGPATSAQLAEPQGVAVDAAGNLYIADSRNGERIRKVSGGTITTVAGGGTASFGDVGPATAASLGGVSGVAVDGTGNLYITEVYGYRVRKVSGGTITTVAGSGTRGYSGDGGAATGATLNQPYGVAVDAAGNLYIADTGNYRVRKVSSQIISTLAGSGLGKFSGDGGPATSASLSQPRRVAVDTQGNLFIADTNNRIRRVSLDGTITTVAGNGSLGFSGDGGPATSASLSFPFGVAVDSAGNLYIADRDNGRVRKVAGDGRITTVAGGGSANPGEGGPATGASIAGPSGVAVDAAGNFYIADTYNHRVRKVSGGIITTVAGNGVQGFSGDGGPAGSASLSQPNGVVVDGNGNVYIADSLNNRIRKVSGGIISTVVGGGTSLGDGGPAASAQLNDPQSLTLDAAGNLFIADAVNFRIRKVSGGTIATVAGNGSGAFSGDGGPATTAALHYPAGVAVDAGGNIYIADTNNDRIRKVLATSPSFAVSTTSLSFLTSAGSGPGAPRQLTLSSGVPGLFWQATTLTSSGGNWLLVSPPDGQMPATVSVSADATNLAAGAYQGRIEFTAPAAPSLLITVAVSLTVSAAQPTNLSVQPSSLSFRVLAGGAAPPAQSLRIENTGGGTLSWTAQASSVTGNWLTVAAAAGSVPSDVQVRANPVGLAAGSYAGSITVRSAGANQSVTVPVSLLVSAPAGTLLLSQRNLLFRAVEGGGGEPAQSFGVLNIGSGSVDWTAQATANWLSVSPTGGRSDAGAAQIPLVSVSVDPSGLVAGFYVGQIRVTAAAANNSPQVVRVDLHVLSRGTRLGAVVRPTGLIFVAAAGGSSPGSQEVSVVSTETSPVDFLSQPIGGTWVTRAPDSGTASRDNPGRIVVQPDLGTLAAGVYRAGLTVFTPGDGVQYPISLLFLVLPAGTVSPFGIGTADGAAVDCTPTQLLLQFSSLFTSFNATVGWPTTVVVNARDNCGNPAVGGTVVLSFSSGEAALTLADLKDGRYQGEWRPNSALSPQVLVAARGFWQNLQGQATATAQVGLNPNPQGAILNQGGVLLGAGFERGPVAPGSIVSLFGQKLATGETLASTLPLPRKLGGVRVLIGDKEAPLFYVGPGQVNAQVPSELAADRQLQVVVESDGVPSAPEPIQTAGNRPGIFTLGGSFGNQGAILIANTNRLAMPVTANVPSEPVPVGGYVSIYCTGLGPTDPAVNSGEPGPSDRLAVVKTPVSVSIGGVSAPVLFAGLAPGFAGVYQVNAQVPAGVAPGNAVPVVITQGSFQSNTATIAVR